MRYFIAQMLIVFILSQRPYTDPNFKYTCQRFVLTWAPNDCKTRDCNYVKIQWIIFVINVLFRQNFAVHGLWPYSFDDKFNQTTANKQEDTSCRIDTKFQPKILQKTDPSFPEKLTKVMPGLKKTPQKLWEKQFQKHGSCKAMLEILNNSNFSQPNLIRKYFQEIVYIYDYILNQTEQKFLKPKYENSKQLAKYFKLKQQNIHIVADNQGYLQQIQFCIQTTQLSYPAWPNFIQCKDTKPFVGEIKVQEWVNQNLRSQSILDRRIFINKRLPKYKSDASILLQN